MRRILLCLTFIMLQACVQGDLESPVKSTPAILVQPAIDSIFPATGSSNGSETLTITGSGFESGIVVTVDGLACNISNQTLDQIECLTPMHVAGVVDIKVKNPNGLADGLVGSFTYQTAPYLASVLPISGPTAGGTLLTLTGNHFSPSASVTVDGFACAGITVVDPNTITCTTIANSFGNKTVIVTNPDLLTGTLANSFEFIKPPVLTSVTPLSGALAGGTSLTIIGSDFLNPIASVDIGGSACTIAGQSIGHVTCTTTAHIAGTQTITLTNSDGQFTTLPGSYTYRAAPTFTSVTPAAGQLAAGTDLDIIGTNFDTINPMTVTVDGNPCTSLVVNSPTFIECKAPAGTLGAKDIRISSASQFVTSVGAYTYNSAPIIGFVTVNSGPLTGGNTVNIVGNNFLPGAVATIGGNTCVGPVITTTNITCPIPVTAYGVDTTVDVIVTNTDAQSVTRTNGYTFRGAPTVVASTPLAGALAGGTNLTITGTGFVSGASVMVGGSACSSVTIISSTSLTCTTTAQAAGTYNITVTNIDSQNATLPTSFTYQDAPTVTAISPAAAPLAAGTLMTITGANFVAGATVTIGGAACTTPVVGSATSLTCTSPTLVQGTYGVVVTNSTQSGSLATAYESRPAPTVTSVTPTAGAIAGGTPLVIYGTNFFTGMNVTVGGSACTGVAVASSTIMACTSPGGVAGARDIVITNLPDSQSATGTGIYTYALAPTIASALPNAGPIGGGTTITITGTNFIATSTVTVAGVACPTTYVNSTTLTCVTAAGSAATVDVAVTNISQTVTSVGAFTYQPPPIIGAVSPDGGNAIGGNVVTINGINFVATSQAQIGGTPCAPTAFISTTQLSCTVPAGALGTVDVFVDNQDSQTNTKTNGYTYRVAPTITTVSPNAGALGGGTTITITGTGFITAPQVNVDGATCTSPTLVNATTITCITAAHVSGVVDVLVLNNDGQFFNSVGAYTYQAAPIFTSVTPSAGALAGGTAIVITGTDFDTVNTPTVTIGGAPCTAGGNTATTINCTTTAHAAGAENITIQNVSQSVTALAAYTYQEAPTIASVSLNAGPIAGGNTITISGTNFITGASIEIDSVACPTTFVDVNTLTCVVAAHAAANVDIKVINPDTQEHNMVGGYTYQLAPTYTSISPIAGFAAVPGMTVTITGTNFVTGAKVEFEPYAASDECINVNVVSATTITCDTQAHAGGLFDIRITNADTQSVTAANQFTFQAAPTISTVSPNGGALAGGTVITLTGTNFYTGATVKVDGLACTTPTLGGPSPATTMTCTTGAHAAGITNVEVLNADGQTDTSVAAFTYRDAPVITSLSKTTGKAAGGDVIIVNGTGFVAGLTLEFASGNDCLPGNMTITSTAITCNVTPAHAAGSVDVIVTNTDSQTDTVSLGFIYLDPPTGTTVSPTSGPMLGGTTITLNGTNFYPGATVTVDSIACNTVNVSNSTTLTCVTPAGTAGAKAIVVTNPDGQSATAAGTFTYISPPTLTSVNFNRGALAGGVGITLTGTDFAGVTSVTIDGNACTGPITVSSTSVTCTTPAGTAGSKNIILTNSDAQTSTLTNGYTYAAAPSVTSTSPSVGTTLGGITVEVNGTGFDNVSPGTPSITFDGTNCPSVIVVSATKLTCIPAAHVAAAVTVAVTNQDTQSGNLAAAYTYSITPAITTISPNSGTILGGNNITITGTDFAGSTVSVGGSACTGPVVTATTIDCTVPAQTAGSYDVVVTNGDGQTATSVNGYTYTSMAKLDFLVGATSPTPPNPDAYGSTNVNMTHTFTVQNTGDLATSVITMTTGGTHPTVFFIGTDTCTGSALAPAASCTVQLTFLAAFFGTASYNATIEASAATGGTATNDVNGTVIP